MLKSIFLLQKSNKNCKENRQLRREEVARIAKAQALVNDAKNQVYITYKNIRESIFYYFIIPHMTCADKICMALSLNFILNLFAKNYVHAE